MKCISARSAERSAQYSKRPLTTQERTVLTEREEPIKPGTGIVSAVIRVFITNSSKIFLGKACIKRVYLYTVLIQSSNGAK